MIDLEFYELDPPGRYLDSCYCDDCLDSFRTVFLNDYVKRYDVAGFRNTVRTNPTFAKAFYLYQRSAIAGYARYLREKVVPKNISLGAFFLDSSTWHGKPIAFYDGLAMGLGTEDTPALAFSESLYTGRHREFAGKRREMKWAEYLQQAQQDFDSLPAKVILVPGLGNRYLDPDQIATLATGYAKASGGFWIFTLSDFNPELKVPLKGTIRDFFNAYKKACQNLDTFSAAGEE